MILPLSTLKQIESYSITITASNSGLMDTTDDIITLRFKQWWKRDTVYRVLRITTDIKKKECVSISSNDVIELIEQLHDYIGETFLSDDEQVVLKNATVLKLVPKSKEATKNDENAKD